MKNKKEIAKSFIPFLILCALFFTTEKAIASVDAQSLLDILENVGFLAIVGMLIASPLGSATGILGTLLGWLLQMFTFISVIAFIITGIMFLFSGTDSGLREKAKSGLVYSIVGIAVGISGYIILKTISDIFQATI